jgi:hypothetical protein
VTLKNVRTEIADLEERYPEARDVQLRGLAEHLEDVLADVDPNTFNASARPFHAQIRV